MQLSNALSTMIIEELAKQGLEVKPFSTDPTGGKGYNCSAFARGEEEITLTIAGEEGRFKPSINVNVNFHRVKTPAVKAVGVNTLTSATLGRVAGMVNQLKGEKK